MIFKDRRDAGRKLGALLAKRFPERGGQALALGLPRGGVPVANEVAKALGAPLDVFIARKLGVPGQEELAMGAISSGGAIDLNREVVDTLGISDELIEKAIAREKIELRRRESLYRGGRPERPVAGKTVFLIDDGLATGATMRAAISALRQRGPAKIVAAVPVGARSTCERLLDYADDVACLQTPVDFRAVGAWYQNFDQTSDQEVIDLLERAAERAGAQAA